MFAIITLISIYFFLTQVKAAGIVARTVVKKSKSKVEGNIKARAAMIFLAPLTMVILFKTVVIGSAIALHKVIDLADLVKSVVSFIA